MGIKVVWANDGHTIILEMFEPAWTWEEFIAVSDTEKAMMDTVDHPVDIIADARHTVLPMGALVNMRRILETSASHNHPNGGMYVIVGANRLLRTFVDIYQRTFSNHGAAIFLAETLEEAYDLIAKKRLAGSARPQGS